MLSVNGILIILITNWPDRLINQQLYLTVSKNAVIQNLDENVEKCAQKFVPKAYFLKI